MVNKKLKCWCRPGGLTALVALLCSVSFTASAVSYEHYPAAMKFVDRMVKEHGFSRQYMISLMADAQRKDSILEAIKRPPEKTKTWGEYRKIFITNLRISQGREFMKNHAAALKRAETDFGVPPEIISAIFGVETRYGRHKGSYRVLDSLATLGFDYPPRSDFFSKQLEQYLLLVKEQKFDARKVKGSYAGAMGYGQFIPSSYRHYAIDFDGDGVADIVNDATDAIGSVANYFKSHGWKPGGLIATRATVSPTFNPAIANDDLTPKWTIAQLQQDGYQPVVAVDKNAPATVMLLHGGDGDEYWIGLQNFYVITRYNHSRLYAMAVYQLSQQLKSQPSKAGQ